MSSFGMLVKHKQTGELKKCMCIDDYFSHREYGYFLGESKVALTGDELDENWERVRDE